MAQVVFPSLLNNDTAPVRGWTLPFTFYQYRLRLTVSVYSHICYVIHSTHTLYLNRPNVNCLVYIESDLSLRLQTNKLILSFTLSRMRMYNAAIHHFSFLSSLFKNYRSRHAHTLMRHFTENYIIEGHDYISFWRFLLSIGNVLRAFLCLETHDHTADKD